MRGEVRTLLFNYLLNNVPSTTSYYSVDPHKSDIIKAHGGELKVETRQGAGSRFITDQEGYLMLR